MVNSGVFYISGRRRGSPNVAGPGVVYPLYPTLSTVLIAVLTRIRSGLPVADRRYKTTEDRPTTEHWPTCTRRCAACCMGSQFLQALHAVTPLVPETIVHLAAGY